MTHEEQDLKERLELAKANLERTRREINARRIEESHKDLSLSIRHEIAARAKSSPIAKGHSTERVRITTDLPKHWIEFQVDRGSECRKLTLLWATGKYITAVCDGLSIGAIETNLEEGRLKIVSVVTREMFMDKCINALGFEVLREAA
jgi:hypothetical protein